MDKELQEHVKHIANQFSHGFEGFEDDIEAEREYSIYDYLEGVLDVNWILNADKSLRGAELLVAFGGPNIYVDTVHKVVTGYWGGSKAEASFNDNVGLKEALETWFSC